MGKIGVITNDKRQVFQRTVITGVKEIASAKGYDVLVDSLAEDPKQPKPLSLPLAQMDGFLVLANALDIAGLQQLRQTGKPITLVSHHEPDIPSVIPNNTEGIRQLADYLVNVCQCRRFVFIQGHMGQLDGVERDKVFGEALVRHDIPIENIWRLRGDFDADIAATSLRNFLQENVPFDAVVAADYLMASVAIDILREAGIYVPDEVCVAGFGDGPEAEAVGLTTVAADVMELGRRAARQLFAQLDGLAIKGVTWLTTEIIERETCKPKLERWHETTH